MCHCKYQRQCDRTTGTCPGPCESGWFGPACQYASAEVRPPTSVMLKSWHDNNHTTCQRTPSLPHILIKLKETFAVTWLRIVVKNAENVDLRRCHYASGLIFLCEFSLSEGTSPKLQARIDISKL
ncbi:fibrinogen-related molecule [Plakobranchus ocellatus]|uniref:Fibrinogen-related molecule n=1 Tax=Plakobranchus ocellatus TaxID=259542 RepID=A0AAV3YE73_9GAST|nr:fibrinogen-related molecule [Plakobranchus ocellatus]